MSDRDWILDGANVHISMVGFDGGTERVRTLDGQVVGTIHPNLTAAADVTRARPLTANRGIGFMGDTKGGGFDISFDTASRMLRTPNINGRPSSDVITPWCNGKDVTQRGRDVWVIDFGTDMSEAESSLYETPFEYVREHVYPERKSNKRDAYRLKWWLHVEPRSGMRRVLAPHSRFLVTPNVTKHRLFVWMEPPVLADHQLIVFGNSEDYVVGVLHSRAHELWARSQGTQLREAESGFRYTPTTCFESFPFPEPFAALRQKIASAANDLDRLRNQWLSPPEWTTTEELCFPGSADGPWKRYVRDVDPVSGIGTVRYPRIVPKNADFGMKLKARTLTNLYNEQPAWLKTAHRKLDEVVFAAYGWKPDISDEEVLAHLLALNLERAARQEAAARLIPTEAAPSNSRLGR